MSNLGNRHTMSENIQYYMSKKGVSRNDLCDALGIKYPTLSGWINEYKYPRIDKIEMMANYFGITKADLVEERTEGYYLDQNTAKLAQEIYEDPETRILLDAKRDLAPNDLQLVVDLVKTLKAKEGK